MLYENEGHNTINMYHTQVPTELRGRGIAGQLAKVSSVLKLHQAVIVETLGQTPYIQRSFEIVLSIMVKLFFLSHF